MIKRFLNSFSRAKSKTPVGGPGESSSAFEEQEKLRPLDNSDTTASPQTSRANVISSDELDSDSENEEIKSSNCRSLVFANGKGGVGKSTIALLSSLHLAIRMPNYKVELLDLDRQGTSNDSINPFVSSQLSVLSSEDFVLRSGEANNGKIYGYLKSHSGEQSKCVFVDTPAGTTPTDWSFMFGSNFIFVPTSSSDPDLRATKKFLQLLFDSKFGLRDGFRSPPKSTRQPFVVVVPNFIEDKEDLLVINGALQEFPCYLGQPLFYRKPFRKAFREGASDENVVEMLKLSSDFSEWFTDLILNGPSSIASLRRLWQL